MYDCASSWQYVQPHRKMRKTIQIFFDYLKKKIITRCAPTLSVVEVFCDWPGLLKHGYAFDRRPKYKPGELIQFNCGTNYVVDGQSLLECQEDGQWSAPLPMCKCMSTQYEGKV